MAGPALLACDWGTTRLRAWLLGEGGEVLADREFEFGVSRLVPGEAERRFDQEIRPALGAEELPAVLCGMVGSELGWRAAGYVDCPASLEQAAAAMLQVRGGAAPVRIAPGVKGPGMAGGADVMRGEETQVFGWIAGDGTRSRGRWLICHPGTHAKWILVEDGRIERFVTFMTGELYGVLSAHSVLRSDAPADDDGAFDEGVAAAGDGGALAARLFTARARIAALGKTAGSTPSYLSGLLIASEIAAAPAALGIPEPRQMVLLGDAGLRGRYGRVLAGRGIAVESADGEAAARAGLLALHRAGARR
jgi:2-dehydro-3-deoxygalactonokinase